MNCQSNSLRRKGLREDLDLSGLMKADKALELNEIQAKEFKNHDKTANVVRFNKKGTQHTPKATAPSTKIVKSHAIAANPKRR